jgi:hypothetical protein
VEHPYEILRCTHCGHPRRVPAYCGNRFCPVCARAGKVRAKRKLQAIVKRLPTIRGYTVKHLTLTIPNVTSPSWGVDTLVSSFRKLRQRSFWRHYVSGGAYVLEITNKGNGWHVHMHAIIHSRFIPWKMLLRHWMAVSPGRGTWITETPINVAIQYLTAYLFKCGLSERHQRIASDALRGRRLFTTFGTWHKIRVRIPHPEFRCPICSNTSWIHESKCRIDSPRVVFSRDPPPEWAIRRGVEPTDQ